MGQSTVDNVGSALLYAAVDPSQKNAAAAVVERAFKVGGKVGRVNLSCWFHRDKLEGIEDSPMWRGVLVRRAPQSNISDAGPSVDAYGSGTLHQRAVATAWQDSVIDELRPTISRLEHDADNRYWAGAEFLISLRYFAGERAI